ncbi:MAG: GNAT family N-acetyltransferase [Candidatus Marinimicrobia bacterium]|nr:GNAT family N-acetyltransferase [Candidatus Neomarinimicrobiota bacterium]
MNKAPRTTMNIHRPDVQAMKFEYEDITLALVQDEDSIELFHLIEKNREYLRQWLPWLDMTKKEEDTKKFIKKSKDQYAQKKGLQFLIRKNGVLIGIIGLPKIDLENKKASIGYWIDQEQQGKGIITKSSEIVIDYCINELRLNTIEIACAIVNRRSKAIPERLGFKKVKTVKNAENLYGTMVDHDIYILKKEPVPNKK